MAVSSLRICMLNGTYYPMVGGAEQQMQQYARLLSSRGHHVQIITYRIQRSWSRKEIVDGVPVTRTGGLYVRGKLRRRWGLAFPSVLWALIRQRKHYDVLHVQQTLEVAFAAIVAGALLHKPVILRLASSGVTNDLRLLSEQNGVLGRWMARAIRRSSAAFVALASTSAAELRMAGIPVERIHWIPNGVDTTRFDRPGSEPTRPHIRRAVCVGHLEHVKGIDVLLRAWQEVMHTVPGASLRIVGGGSQRQMLTALAHKLAIDSSVEFVGETRDVRPYLAQADFFVLPSRAEGLPNALLEAMSAGLPCIATRVGACGDLIQDSATGLLVEPENASALAQAMLAYMANPALAHDCSRRASVMVEQRYDIEKTVQQYEELYLAVLGRRDRPVPGEAKHVIPAERAPHR